ncbi:MAG: hypothetical protein M3440_04560 [Chloroflexota bacterium]|nr:hypothetical protein [Chloroflexota bacterium]
MTALVTRDKYGPPYLRGTRLRVSDIQSWDDARRPADHLRYEYPSALADWSDEDIATALTYPRISGTTYTDTSVALVIDDDGDISVEGWFEAADAPLVIAAIERARERVAAWEQVCDAWEKERGGGT